MGEFCIPIMTSKGIVFSATVFLPPQWRNCDVCSQMVFYDRVISVHIIYLHNAVGPSLPDSVPCPNIVPIFRQLLHQLVLIGRQFDMIEVQRSRFVPTAHHITDQETEQYENQNLIYLQDKRVLFFLVYIRFGQFDLPQILLCFLISHAYMASQS